MARLPKSGMMVFGAIVKKPQARSVREPESPCSRDQSRPFRKSRGARGFDWWHRADSARFQFRDELHSTIAPNFRHPDSRHTPPANLTWKPAILILDHRVECTAFWDANAQLSVSVLQTN